MTELNRYIDHTDLTVQVNKDRIRQLCEEAIEHQFASVCVPPYFVKNAARFLEESSVKVSTVVGFPLGYSATFAKVDDIKKVVDDGAQEVDTVINISAALENDWVYLRNEIESIVQITHLHGKAIKVILETALLKTDQLDKLLELCAQAGVDFVKTSTGYAGGADVKTVQRMREKLPADIRIKASGGIRSKEEAIALIEAGAVRLGTSKAIQILGL